MWILALPVPPHREPPPERPGGGATWRGSIPRFIADARGLLAIRTLRWVMLSATTMAFAAGGYAAWLKEFLDPRQGT